VFEMPKFKTKESEQKYDAYNELRRNLKLMTMAEMERFVHGESLVKILGKKYKHGMK
jgi:hypothetical protein